LNETEQEIIKRSLKAISQIEVKVKEFWGNIYKFFPKPEFFGIGATLAENEFRHSEAYSELLDVIGIENDEFEKFCEIEPIKKRINYLAHVNQSLITDPYSLCKSICIFTIAVENASLFSQFAIVLSFQRFKGTLKNVADQISWTSKDENVHASFGIWLIQKLIEEYGDQIDMERLKTEVVEIIQECYEAEAGIIDFIYENGELEDLSADELKDFVKYRIDKSTKEAGLGTFFGGGKNLMWFDEIVFGPNQKDFFVGRPSDYSVLDVSFTEDDLF
jgi:ribonucleoside-diphosphate reductase beta chain